MYLPRVWLITGASSGLGKALTEAVLRKGDIVVATLRKPSVLVHLTKQYPPSQLLLLTLDVIHASDISAAFTRTKEAFGRLDVVFNNAGCAIFGEVEATSDADARALFDVNFWGVVGVSRAAVRFFREVNPPGKGGILLQNSSMMSLTGAPGISFYSASKHAVDGFSESLAKELLPEWNIKICVLQTGIFATNIFAACQYLPVHSAYTRSVSTAQHRNKYQNMTRTSDGANPYEFAELLYRLVAGVDSSSEPIPQFLPIGEDALRHLKGKLNKMNKALVDVALWSADLRRDRHKDKARL